MAGRPGQRRPGDVPGVHRRRRAGASERRAPSPIDARTRGIDGSRRACRDRWNCAPSRRSRQVGRRDARARGASPADAASAPTIARCRHAALAQRRDRRRARALRQPLAAGGQHQRHVRERGRRGAERAVERELARRRAQQIVAAHDAGDPHRRRRRRPPPAGRRRRRRPGAARSRRCRRIGRRLPRAVEADARRARDRMSRRRAAPRPRWPASARQVPG